MEPTTKTLTLAERAYEARRARREETYQDNWCRTSKLLIERLASVLGIEANAEEFQVAPSGAAYYVADIGIPGTFSLWAPSNTVVVGIEWCYRPDGIKWTGGTITSLPDLANVIDDIDSGAVWH